MNTSSASPRRGIDGEFYQIRIGQQLDPECSAWLAGLAITNLPEGEAVLSGYLVDQAALYGVLQCLCDLNVPLLDLRRGARQ